MSVVKRANGELELVRETDECFQIGDLISVRLITVALFALNVPCSSGC